MKKYLCFLLFFCSLLATGQSGALSWDRQSSVRYGAWMNFDTKKIPRKMTYVGSDFFCPIGEEDFYLGGRLLFISEQANEEPSPTASTQKNEEKSKISTVYPEITLRKYFWERNLCPYAQMGLSYASSSLFLGIKPQVMLFELDLSAGYHWAFRSNPMEKAPYLPSGFQVLLTISVPFEVLGIEI